MWRVTKKGRKEAKNIFDIKNGMDLDFSSQNIEQKNLGFEYFKDSVEVEVSKISEDSKEETEESFDNTSFQSVRVIRNPKRGKTEKLC